MREKIYTKRKRKAEREKGKKKKQRGWGKRKQREKEERGRRSNRDRGKIKGLIRKLRESEGKSYGRDRGDKCERDLEVLWKPQNQSFYKLDSKQILGLSDKQRPKRYSQGEKHTVGQNKQIQQTFLYLGQLTKLSLTPKFYINFPL